MVVSGDRFAVAPPQWSEAVREVEMVIDEKFIDSFGKQIKVLENLKASVEAALKTANQRYDRLKDRKNLGKNYEDLIALEESK
jgi:hypothetical protein